LIDVMPILSAMDRGGLSMRWHVWILAGAVALAGCADLTSIGRRSNLPSSTTVDGRALHLDAKQRVVLAKAGRRGINGGPDMPDMACAEPSPDALSAFASSFSGGISVSGQGAGSAAGALSEAAASIGLRTQSITLMRDALYRVCEAYYNGQLSGSQVMTLMARSQDLTAAVVSVEQLTGAIVAQQAALGGGANAASSATMLSNAEALTKVRELEKQYEGEIVTLTAERKKAVDARDAKQLELKTARAELDQTPTTDTDKRAKLQLRIDEITKNELPPLETAATEAETKLALKEQQRADIAKARAAIEAQLDSSITSASAAAASNATLSGGSTVSRLDKETATAIAGAVSGITTTIVGKSYVVEECMAIMTSGETPSEDLKALCNLAVKARVEADAKISQAAAAEADAAKKRAQADILKSDTIIKQFIPEGVP
jgi:hypothetical protein